MNIKELAIELSKLEGKKKEVTIGNIREILSVLKKLIKKDPSILKLLLK